MISKVGTLRKINNKSTLFNEGDNKQSVTTDKHVALGFQIVLVFEERGKPENPEKNFSEQGQEPTKNSTQI